MDLFLDGAVKPPAFDETQLTLCDREPIHTPGTIQPHGALLALHPANLCVAHAGGDTLKTLGVSPRSLLGENGAHFFSEAQLTRLRELANGVCTPLRAVHPFSIASEADAAVISDVICYRSGQWLVAEFDPRREPAPDNPLTVIHAMLRSIQEAETAQAFCQAVVDEVRRVIGFDRVMFYRFLDDGSGAVVAESLDAGVDSFLGLHYPESDIPKQARELYRTNWIRAIPDARYAPAPILSMAGVQPDTPLDLSRSIIRSVSPVHRQYLANMGVVASLSMSVIMRGQLFGLIACHHRQPRYLPYALREACELFAEMVSSQLQGRAAAERFKAEQRGARVHEELVNRMSQEAELAAGLIRFRPNLLDLIPAGGVGLWIDGQFSSLGATPRPAEIEAIVTWLNATVKEGVFHTDRLPLRYPAAASFADVASGLLALSVSRNPRDYVLWFRPELVRTVNWAGKPDKAVPADGEWLTPRKSFALWQEQVRLHASPWLGSEVDAAHRLRASLLEVVLRRIDQIAREREAARGRQQQLTTELNERLAQSERLAQALQRETELRAVAEQELSQVLRRTVDDQEVERQRLARELHDTLGQSLTMLQLGLQAIGQEIPAGQKLHQRLDAVKDLAANLGSDVNRLAWEIRPTAIDDIGIQTAIENLMERWSEHSSLKYYLHISPKEMRLPKAVETTLYRVLQEALTNVVRHAEAQKVGVVLNVVGSDITMIVEDDGRGFLADSLSAAITPAARLGLIGIRERLALVDGSMEIESAPRRGTTVFIRIPI